jgi:TM2 domain-containing membrane protein YozV
MSYLTSGATLRGDITTAVIQAANADQGFIGSEVFPVYNSSVRAGQYLKLKLGNAELLNSDASKVAPGSSYPRTSRAFDNDNFTCSEFGLEEVVPDALAADVARFFGLETETAKLLLRNITIGHEAEVASALFDSGTFTATNPLVNYTVTNLSTINFVADVAAAKQRLLKNGLIPNAVIMNQEVFDLVRRSPLAQNQFFGVISNTGGRLLSEAEIAAVAGVEKCLVGKAAKNTAAKGLAFSGGFILPTTYIAVGYVAGGDFAAGGVGRTIVWSEDTSAPFVTESYRDEIRRSKILRVRSNRAVKVIDETSVELITTNYSAS